MKKKEKEKEKEKKKKKKIRLRVTRWIGLDWIGLDGLVSISMLVVLNHALIV
jgi:hypothetical protein